jgi:polyphosphate kinase 2 (PPK2 family)
LNVARQFLTAQPGKYMSSKSDLIIEDSVTEGDNDFEGPDHYLSGEYIPSISRKIRKDATEIGRLFKEGKYPYTDRLARKKYEKEKARLQIELLKIQNWVKLTGQKIVVIFEGRDAAGKGGTIKRFMEHLNPRAAKVVALEKPTKHESGQWYFQRYIQHLPTSGEILFLDRSWYNRAGVERVM